MHNHKKKQEKADAIKIEVRVDVAKIVKYCCFAGIVIVSVIFGTGAWIKSMQLEQREQ